MTSPHSVLRRTERGVSEVHQPSKDLSRVARLVLILADGTLTIEQIQTRLPAVQPERIHRAAQRLIDAGLLEEASTLAPEGQRPSAGKVNSAHGDTDLSNGQLGQVSDRLQKKSLRSDDAASRRDLPARPWRGLWGRWAKRTLGLALAVVAATAAAVMGVAAFSAARHDLSAAGVAARLGAAFGAPVTVGSAGVRWVPMPALAYRDIELPGGVKVREAALVPDLRKIVGSGARGWGMVVIPELSLAPAQALALLQGADTAVGALPEEFQELKVEVLRVTDSPLLEGRYRADLMRVDGAVRIELREDRPRGSWSVVLRTPVGAADEPRLAQFELMATEWSPPAGPALQWDRAAMRGWLSSRALVCESLVFEGFGGGVTGAGVLAGDQEWVGAFALQATNINLALLLGSLAPPAASAAAPVPVPLNGIAESSLTATGRGLTLMEAMADFRADGSVSVVRATLNGVNLGLAAAQGSVAGMGPRGGGVTRFSELTAAVNAAPDGLRFSDVRGRAGAMTVRGEFLAKPDQTLAGRLRVELGGSTVQAPFWLRLGGTALMPDFDS